MSSLYVYPEMVTFKRNAPASKRHVRNCGRKRVIRCVKNGLKNATTHGLPYIANDRIHLFERIFWLVNFSVALIIICLLLTTQFLRFMDTPTVISVDLDYFDWNISYPAITLCPLYKTNVTVFKEIVRDKFNETGLKVDKYLWAITQANFETLHYVVLDVPEELRSVFHPNEYANIAESMFQKFGGNVSTKTNHNVTIVSAMTELGMCHVLNSNVAVFDDPRKWNVSNTKYFKNNIELSIYDRDFFIQISKYADIFKVYIHSPDEIITGTTSSFTVDMEAAISFGLSVWTTRISEELRQMPLAIRKCRFINEATSARYPIYSYSHCILECRIDVIKTLCGCVPHFYKPLAHENICHIEQLKCLVKYKKEILTLSSSEATKKYPNLPSNSRDCGCLSTCELDQYHKDREDVTSRTYVNTLDIEITSFPKVRVTRDIIFNFHDILLRSGGVINLCIGSSVISIMELIITAVKTFVYIIISSIKR